MAALTRIRGNAGAAILAALLAIAVISCGGDRTRIKSLADEGLGYWARLDEATYVYRISDANKEKLYVGGTGALGTKRDEKLLLGIAYINDIDSGFIGTGTNGFSLNLQSEDTLIEGRDRDYLIRFIEYKDIYFPESIKILEKRR
ncbi:MAG: hypothetical protein KKA67_16820 [Spirochaetes bacterium]|nr:hypothetical protein [Spirochaetota bacterium]MBU1080231.1 hypothetical protein [Spirochaetota bacterium]